jgi:hypothetical protein
VGESAESINSVLALIQTGLMQQYETVENNREITHNATISLVEALDEVIVNHLG